MHIKTQKQSFTYLGGKFSVLPWLLPLIDIPCEHFIDVFGGSAVVLLNIDQKPIETYNDINGLVVNFFKVLRDYPDRLIQQLELTPHSRQEYDLAWISEHDSPVEQARKFFIRTQQSMFAAGAHDKLKGWACATKVSRCTISERTNKWLRAVENLYEIAERLKHVQIENRDFKFILKSYDFDGAFFYCDSPYENTYRSSTKYTHEFTDNCHIDLHELASKVKGKIAISGYGSPFMTELYSDFYFYAGPKRKNGKSDKPAFECLWTNYKIVQPLNLFT